MYRYLLSILFVIFLGKTTFLAAQAAAQLDYRVLVAAIGQDIEKGEKRALRDLGTLLDESQVKPKIIEILQEHTLFTPQELVLDQTLNKKTFLDFYYKKEAQFYFSPLLKAFYTTPIEARMVEYQLESGVTTNKVDPSILLRKYAKNLETAFLQQEEKNILNQIDSITLLRSEEGYEVLLKFIENDFSFSSNPKKLYGQLLKSLANYPERTTLLTILRVIQKEKLHSEILLTFLAELTNIKLASAASSEEIVQRYQHYLDSLGSMKALRQFGYESVTGLHPSFFEFEVDYYGKILSEADEYPWIQWNVMEDIQKTLHPRALFYLAAQVFHYRNSDKNVYTEDQYLALLQRITQIKVAIKDQKGAWTTTPDWDNDPVALRNFLYYWSAQYEDYEWDEVRMSFVNKNEAVAQTETYERLFRRLNSSNDSVALVSYQALAQGDPVEVIELAKKYKELLRSYNKNLPSIKYQYLEQLVLLTNYCRQNNFIYQPEGTLYEQLVALTSSIKEQERFDLENQIIHQIEVRETAVLEYWGCLYANHRDFSFSIGRILTWVYAEQWDKIISDDDLLRFYLKKTYLLRQIGVIGVCNHYLKQFENPTPDLVHRLKNLLTSESDKDIIQIIKNILGNSKMDTELKVFLENPLSMAKKDLKNLPPITLDNYLEVFQVLQLEDNQQAINQLIDYIKMYAQIDMIPDLMRLLQIQIAPEEVVQVIGLIYDQQDNPENWLQKWYNDQNNFKQWGEQFFDEKLKLLEKQDSISIEDINAITTSPFYQEKYKHRCLKALVKLNQMEDIRRLKIQPLLPIKDDLRYFTTYNFSYKALDDIPKLFDTSKDAATMLSFIAQQCSSFSIEEKGAFYNNLFRSSWFVTSLAQGEVSSSQADTMELALMTYLAESELISEFEEQATLQNVAQLRSVGKNLEEKLLMSFQLDIDAAAKAKIQKNIIATTHYQDLPVIMKYFDQLSPAYQYNFLNLDFGLPIFELDNVQEHQQIIALHQKLTEAEVYKYYLERFGVDFQDKNGNLDYTKMLKMLKYDVVTPFVNGGGTQRDYYVFGLIKLLELEFNTNLGFHKKLNENQIFYAFSASKRAEAWQTYLKNIKS